MGVLADIIRWKEGERLERQQNAKVINDLATNMLAQKKDNMLMQMKQEEHLLNVQNVESQIEARKKGSVFDQLKQVNAVQDFALKNKDKVMYDAAGNVGRSLLAGDTMDKSSNKGLLADDGTVNNIPTNTAEPVSDTTQDTAQAPVQGSVTSPKDTNITTIGDQKYRPTKLDAFGRPEGYERIPEKESLDIKEQNIKNQEKEEKKLLATENLRASTQDSIDTIDKIIDGEKYFGAGALVPAIPSVQGDKVKWQANFNRLKATLVLDVMSNLKAASATGSTGFGQLSEKELQLLQDAATELDKTMDPKDAVEVLTKMRSKFEKILDNKKDKTSKETTIGKFQVEVL